MRLIIATPIYPPEIGGPATYTKELCERIHDKYDITVIAYTDAHDAFSGTKLISIPKNRPLLTRLVKFTFALYQAAKNADVIYVQNAMAAGLPVAIVKMLTGKPYILKFVGDEAWERATQHKLTEKSLEEFLERPEAPLKIRAMMAVQGFVLRHANIVTTPSEYLGRAIQKAYRIDPKKVITNYNAADKTETLPFEIKIVPNRIVTTARLTSWKGVDGIIRALKIVRERYKNATLYVAGEGPEYENLKKLTKDLGLEDCVNLLGRISRAETWQLRKNSEIYVLNSTYEGLPHTALTTFAAGIPIVATDIPGTNEAVYNERTGLLVKPGDDKGLANAIIRYFDDKKLKKRVVENAKKILQEKFSWESHIDKLNGFFQSVVSKPNN